MAVLDQLLLRVFLAEERVNSLSTARWDKPRDVGPDGKITDWNRQTLQ